MTGGGAGRRRGAADRRPHFIILVWAVVPGGTLGVLRDWVPRLAERGDVTVVSLGPNRASLDVPTVTLGGRRSHPFRFPNVLGYVARMSLAAVRSARGTRPTALLPQDALATGAAAAIAARISGARLAVMEHGSTAAVETEGFWRERGEGGRSWRLRQRMLRRTLRALRGLVMRRLDVALVAGEDAVAAFRSRGVGDDRLLRYRFGIDVALFHPPSAAERTAARGRWGVDGDEPVVVAVGRLAPEKGLEHLVAAVAGLPDDVAPRLLVAGDGPLRAELERAASERGIAVTFVGGLEPPDVASILHAADCFAYPALRGANTPFAVLEAMATGLPVVATTAPEVHREMLARGRGIAVEPGDVMALRTGIDRLLRDRLAAASAGAAARDYVVERHGPARADEAVSELVRRLWPED